MPSFSQLLSRCHLTTEFLKYYIIRGKEESLLKCSLLPTEYFWVTAPNISISVLSLWDILSILCHYSGNFQFSSQSENTYSLSIFFRVQYIL